MKRIKTRDAHSSRWDEEQVEAFVAWNLGKHDAAAAMGRLVQLLTDKGLLNAEEVQWVVLGHNEGEFVLVEEED